MCLCWIGVLWVRTVRQVGFLDRNGKQYSGGNALVEKQGVEGEVLNEGRRSDEVREESLDTPKDPRSLPRCIFLANFLGK